MARRSRFSEDQRRAAVERAFRGDSSPPETAAELGVSVATLYRWASEPKTEEPTEDDATARRLTDAAQQLLRTAGYPDITVEDVARHADVPLRTAFDRFGSKRALFGATVDRAARSIVDLTAARASAIEWPEDPARRLALFLVVNSEATYAEPAGHVLFRDLGIPLDDRFAEHWHETFRLALTALLDDVAAAGALRPGLAPSAAATVLARALRGIHTAVFDGAPRDVALEMIGRLPALVAATPEK